MKRIAIIQVLQESNTFDPALKEMDEFVQFGIGLGDEVISRYGEVDEIGGFLEGLRGWDEPVEPVGILRAQGWMGGRLSHAAFEWLAETITEQLAQVPSLDGVLFALHGALVGEQLDDVDGELLKVVRARVGPDVPIVATLDLHAYVTERMCHAANVLVAYLTSPISTAGRPACARQRYCSVYYMAPARYVRWCACP